MLTTFSASAMKSQPTTGPTRNFIQQNIYVNAITTFCANGKSLVDRVGISFPLITVFGQN
jgi:hypothetical protein